jgi:hypothetical protein
MKFEITRRGVHDADGAVIAIGDTVEVETKDGETPAWLVNKAVPVKGGKASADDGSLEAQTVPELKALAEAEEIDLGDATKKADIIAAIELAREAKA